jgi:AmiR/NasT family two-component response regulator
VVDAALPLLRADGAGLMLDDEAGALRWVTASSPARRAFEQAKGILMERKGMAAQEAFDLLRRLARSSSRKLTEVAADVIEGRAP